MDFRSIFEKEFVNAFDCASSVYERKIPLGDDRFLTFKLVNASGANITKDSQVTDGRITVNFWNSTGSDPEFITDGHGTIARVDNDHFNTLDAHSGDQRFDQWKYGTTLSTFYLVGSVILTDELTNLIRKKQA